MVDGPGQLGDVVVDGPEVEDGVLDDGLYFEGVGDADAREFGCVGGRRAVEGLDERGPGPGAGVGVRVVGALA